jgi:hypothetical protein
MTPRRVDSPYIPLHAVAARLMCQIMQYIKFALDPPISLPILLRALLLLLFIHLQILVLQRSKMISVLITLMLVNDNLQMILASKEKEVFYPFLANATWCFGKK